MLNVMLAVVNLLPIPGLDGGHLMWLGIESCRKRPLSRPAACVDSRGHRHAAVFNGSGNR